MTEQEEADQFSRDVDELLQGGGPQPAEAAPANRWQGLALARLLATADFSPESRQRLALRRRLLGQMDADAQAQASLAPAGFWAWATGLRPLLRRGALASGVVAALLIIHLAWSGALQTGAVRLNGALYQTVVAGDFSRFLSPLGYVTPVTTTLGVVVDAWSAAPRPAAVAASGIPGSSTTVSIGSVVGWGGPPK